MMCLLAVRVDTVDRVTVALTDLLQAYGSLAAGPPFG